VFDRVRENLKNSSSKKSFSDIVGESIGQTLTRSINTSLTTLLALVVLYFVGGESTQHFSLALIIGIVAGTYSSIFLGSPLLVTVWKWQEKRRLNKKGKN
jgi:preprotein translocase subunit SecF